MKITDRAIQKLIEYRPSSEDVLSVTILGGGCSGMSYKMEWIIKSNTYDKVLFTDQNSGLKVVTNSRSGLFLEEAELDFTDGLNGKGFEWNNPIAKRVCGCGESFSV